MPIIKKYLLDLGTDVCRVDATIKPGHKSHIRDEISLPTINALAEGAKVMLLVNYVVEEDLYNGAVGTIRKLVYSDPDGPRKRGNQPAYAVVDFPKCGIPPEKAWDRQNPTWVPIPLHTQRCEKKCCSVETLPLRIAKALTIDKSQGMTVGEGEFWELLVCMLPPADSVRSKTPGLAQVGVSRVTEIERLAMLSTTENPLTREALSRIGTTDAYKRRNDFEASLKAQQASTQARVRAWITDEDQSDDGPKTFEGGYKALVAWYRDQYGAIDS